LEYAHTGFSGNAHQPLHLDCRLSRSLQKLFARQAKFGNVRRDLGREEFHGLVDRFVGSHPKGGADLIQAMLIRSRQPECGNFTRHAGPPSF
jgi:hypothetical protein